MTHRLPSEVYVTYIASKELAQISALLPSNKKRSLIVHSLASSLGVLSNVAKEGLRAEIRVVNPVPASYEELATYHSRDYLEFVLDPKNSRGIDALEGAEYGLEDDCPPFPGLPHYVRYIAGATLTAVRELREGRSRIAICWDGGRHHAQKSKAAGFCYVADCVLAILALRRLAPDPRDHSKLRKPRVMYLDLDVHFSDGVCSAFQNSSSSSGTSTFLHFSIHHAAPGFFPASPLSTLPSLTSDPFLLSLPLNRGASNATIRRIWLNVVEKIREAFVPDYVVLQCGVDGLAGDPTAVWNWGLGGDGGIGWCVGRVLEWDVPTLLLGGGGYNSPNAARAYAYLTSIARGGPLPLDTPLSHELYAPSFELDVPPGNMQDSNTGEYLNEVEKIYWGIVEEIRERCSRS
ncbi:histone deacetylase complex protein [Neolentinus lepideus HHB14362 ss-1]|uniref:histone deacetylase n=1 Tax=Neolentinus lepideus HHB14362 ss-1 TaxID=1314782 RepID=A0A165QR76_9AGAM|nr:histone deacetylase complex protein [Neolentinus lepideus HHB14362 ss-1]